MRPAQILVNAMGKYPCEVTILTEGRQINGKSILSVLSACIRQGSEIEIRCSGEEEQVALEGGCSTDPVPGDRGIGRTAKEEMSTMIPGGIRSLGGRGDGPGGLSPGGGAGPRRKRVRRGGGTSGPACGRRPARWRGRPPPWPSGMRVRAGESEPAILTGQITMLRDPELELQLDRAIQEGETAEAAVDAVFGGYIRLFEGLEG